MNETIYKTIKNNEFKLALYIALTGAIIFLFGYIISEYFNFGLEGVLVIFVIASAVNFISYFFSKTMVLKSQKAIPLTENDYPEYIDMVKEMCRRNNIMLPELYYINSKALNAFATGRNQKDCAVVVTSGLLKSLPLEEVSGVVGHELSHIVHKDIMITSLITTLVGYITIMATAMRSAAFRSRGKNAAPLLLIGLAVSILAPFIGLLIRMAVSRSREYMADATGAEICGNPEYLAKALYRISHDGNEMPMVNEATAPLYISNPIKNKAWETLFSTHPDINDRIQRLQAMKSYL